MCSIYGTLSFFYSSIKTKGPVNNLIIEEAKEILLEMKMNNDHLHIKEWKKVKRNGK